MVYMTIVSALVWIGVLRYSLCYEIMRHTASLQPTRYTTVKDLRGAYLCVVWFGVVSLDTDSDLSSILCTTGFRNVTEV